MSTMLVNKLKRYQAILKDAQEMKKKHQTEWKQSFKRWISLCNDYDPKKTIGNIYIILNGMVSGQFDINCKRRPQTTSDVARLYTLLI